MHSSQYQIILIMSSNEDNAVKLRKFLLEKGYNVTHISNVNEGIVKVQESYPDLVICQNQLNGNSGLKVYHTLHKDLVKQNIPFFIFFPEYKKEEILIGLEMGVDNFIISPFDEETLGKKVENHLNKMKKLKIIDSEQFKISFETTPVAKFIAENNQMIMANKALEKLTGISFKGDQLPVINGMFDFSEDENLALEFRRCMSGLKDYCLFKSVPLKSKKQARFDIHLVCTDYFRKGLFMAEVVANGENAKTNNYEVIFTDYANPYFGNENDEAINLTPREEEVLEWSQQGLPIKQIATILKISNRTVEKHRANIMAKTETDSIVEAIYAIRQKTG